MIKIEKKMKIIISLSIGQVSYISDSLRFKLDLALKKLSKNNKTN